MVGDATQGEQIGCLVVLTLMALVFAIMLPVMMFMYIDMYKLRTENDRINNKIGKYRDLIERCER